MLLVIDNGSVYTKNLTDFLTKQNILFETQIPHLLDPSSLENYDSFILSGRRKNDKKINEINSKVITYSIENNIKLLGICYGAEILALTLGGTIRKLPLTQNGIEKIAIIKDNLISSGYLEVFESHGFEISKLPEALIPLAESKNCRYEIIQHKTKPIFGTQFHPEMSNDGHELIKKFCLF